MGVNIRIHGDEGSLEWHQENPNRLVVKYPDCPQEILTRGGASLHESARCAARIPAGHPEGYLEAFANLYREAFRAISAEVEGRPIPPNLNFPTIDDGVAGMRFVESAVESARQGSKWVTLPWDQR